ncbi:DNA methyltransferase [Sorangium sp. So ce448]|uniref:DNA methyltransferase n=1 Tax=Sorangium sp. So ce448 TaxID=3133314 RepID=UPI003F63146D
MGAKSTFSGRDAQTRFVKAFFACFGWRDGEPPGADIPASLSVVELGQRTTRPVAALWSERRILVDVVAPEVALDTAWNDLLRACLEQSPGPQFVILTNQRELRLYDLGRDRSVPRLATPIDDLPKYSDAFVFLGEGWVPGTTPKIVNVGKVSREVADVVAKLYRSLKAKFPKREADIIQFTLQCIITMFAEDIGLLPPDYFTTLLYEGARHRDVERRLRELFTLMATRDVKPPRPVAYFNGGLFAAPVTLPLGDAELTVLTRAAEANWKYVDPHIFGSVFQGIMDDAERHASGAHYTAHEDIMRVVGPTIVEPWRKRIAEAKTLAELLEVRRALSKFRVLDPACGSGNFLYVAFRELYNLETQVLARIREFPSGQGIGWGSVISTLNFHGFDTNEFAVQLARVTLNIAKKIAFEDRRQKAADASFQGELEVDPSLPLDNLDKNIVCADALFTEWPEVDAIVGNPPFLAGTSISSELSPGYLAELRDVFPDVPGRADYCCYWFRRAHDRLPRGGRAGLIGTSSVREGNSRVAALEYIVANGATITNAVSSRPWPGAAAVNVAMVNWTKGDPAGPHVLEIEGVVHEVRVIAPHLQLHADVSDAREIRANDGPRSSQGIHVGSKCNQVNKAAAAEMWSDHSSRPFIHPVADGNHLLGGKLSTSPDYIVDMSDCRDLAHAQRGGAAFAFLKRKKFPEVQNKSASFEGWSERWWQSWRPREAFFQASNGMRRIIVCSKHAARPIFAFLSTSFFPTDSLQMFAFDDDYAFGLLQSSAHWRWAIAKGSKLVDRIRYTMDVWNTFPWPQEASESSVARVAAAARELRATRDRLMEANGWSLRALYQAAEVAGPHPLKDVQRALDEAVSEAYGMPSDQDVTEFLLDLNRCLVEDEEQGRTVTGPGLPPGLDPKDPRWLSADCIKPPPLSE